MAQIFSAGLIYAGLILTLAVVLTTSAVVWRTWEIPSAKAAPMSLSISEIMRNVDAKSLPVERVDDRSMVFLARADSE